MTAFPLIFLVYDKIQFKIAKNNNAKISIWLISTHMLIDVLYLLNIPTVHIIEDNRYYVENDFPLA